MLSERVEAISQEAARMLAELRHPVRLPILLALEERPRSASEMAEDLGEAFDRVNHAMRALAAAGLIELLRQEPAEAAPNLLRRVDDTRYTGWDTLVATLEAIVATSAAGAVSVSAGGDAGGGSRDRQGA
jgi:DNA-binding transcriptional ArsR family regulator